MLGTNLSLQSPNGTWTTDTTRLILMDRNDFSQLGLSIDDLIEAYIQTVLSVVAIDRMAKKLLSNGEFNYKLFKSLNPDNTLIDEIRQANGEPLTFFFAVTNNNVKINIKFLFSINLQESRYCLRNLLYFQAHSGLNEVAKYKDFLAEADYHQFTCINLRKNKYFKIQFLSKKIKINFDTHTRVRLKIMFLIFAVS